MRGVSLHVCEASGERNMILTLTTRLEARSGLSTEQKELAEALAKAKAIEFGGRVALWDAVKDASHECSLRWDVGDAIAIITHGLDTRSARKGVAISDDLYVFGVATRLEEDSIYEARPHQVRWTTSSASRTRSMLVAVPDYAAPALRARISSYKSPNARGLFPPRVRGMGGEDGSLLDGAGASLQAGGSTRYRWAGTLVHASSPLC